ncbi:RMD1 family protein [Flectobacillus roseus]|uniref:RMD1 family protein n=1 Tax=Flectobacillus roseus TaxID=502259 RepID=A0ABT6Y6Q5_9BACT|nr:RMD1 family protein [Flectobacillus roseus]MDI9859201.1 RMD1 family protein [Flectobacillus roseus]
MKIDAYQISEVFNLKKFKQDYTSEPSLYNNSELFYKREDDTYIYLLSYGVVVFAGVGDLEKSEFLKFIKNYAEGLIEEKFEDDFIVQTDPSISVVLKHNSITVSELTDDSIRIIMLNIGQSVALDYYEALTYKIATSTKQMTDELEHHGRLKSSQSELLKFIGKTINIKNSIIDNLYIFDSPEEAWENEHLERIDKGLKKTFDLKMRYQDIEYKLKIVQENLTLFMELVQNRESTRLEWVIIILILIEVFDLIFTKIF